MSITRRQFILGTGAGLILPAYYDKVFTFFENHGEPLIEVPRRATIDLFAVDRGAGYGYQLNVGDPWAEPPAMTIREYANRYYEGEEHYREDCCDGEEVDFDDFIDPEFVVDCWARTDSPNAQAFYLLEDLDLGPDLDGADAVGAIRFIDGPMPGSDYTGVEAADQVSLSLLQKRLNEMNTGIQILLP